MYGTSHQKIVVLHRVTRSTLYDHISDRVRRGTTSIPNLFPEAPTVNPVESVNDSNDPVDSIESFNGAQPSLSNLPANTEAIESLDGISNLPAKLRQSSHQIELNHQQPTYRQILRQCPTHSIQILYL